MVSTLMKKLISLITLSTLVGVGYAGQATTADFFAPKYEKNNRYLSAASAPAKFDIHFSIAPGAGNAFPDTYDTLYEAFARIK